MKSFFVSNKSSLIFIGLTLVLGTVALSARASTIPDHLIMATVYGNDSRPTLINGTTPQNKTITSELFTSEGVAGTSNYGELFLAFDTPAHVSQICWTNGTYAGDYMRGADLMFDTTEDYGVYQTAGSNSGFAANATACVAADTTQWSKYWKVVMSPPAQWRHWADVAVTVSFSETVTPTSTPDANIATPMPQGALPCITGTTSISPTTRATLTPWVRTGTAVTRTPGGPTPTPPAPYTVTVRPLSSTVSYDSGLMRFDTDVNQLASVGQVNVGLTYKFLRWSDTSGNDGHAGVAWLHTAVGNVMTITQTELEDHSGLVGFYKAGGFQAPVAVSFYARTAHTITVGLSHFMRVWYLDPNYDGHGTAVWVSQWDEYLQGSNFLGPTVGGLQLSNSWRKFGAVVRPIGGSGTIAAIGFDDYVAGSGDPGAPCAGYGCVYMDDLRIAYGDAAGLVLPYCLGTDPHGLNGKSFKTCVVPIITIDLQAVCVAPTTIDFGAWLSYFWCRLWHFIGFFPENTAQWDAIIARQSANEPFGSIFEAGAISDDLNTSIDDLRASSKSQPQTPIDWVATFLDGTALDYLPQFTVPDIASASEYMANCPAEAMFSNSTASGACMALYMMRQTIIITLFQWGLNAVFVVGIIMLIRSDLEKLAS